MKFNAPIPGESLTKAPKNYPWERPPEVADPEEALQLHISKINTPERLSSILDLIELDTDIMTITTGLLRSAVSKGIHSLDVSMVIAPVIHEFIRSTAEMAGIDYDDGFEDLGKKEKLQKQVMAAKASKQLRNMKLSPTKEDVAQAGEVEDTGEAMVEEGDIPVDEEPVDVAEPLPERKGLMARPTSPKVEAEIM